MDAKTRLLWDEMVDCQLGLLSALDQKLVQTGLNSLVFEVLRLLSASPDSRLRLAELAQGVRHSQSGTTRLVDRLEKDGLIRRHNCDTDRRVTYAELTEQGRSALELSRPAWESFVRERVELVLTDQERDAYQSILRKLAEADRGVHLDGVCAAVSQKR